MPLPIYLLALSPISSPTYSQAPSPTSARSKSSPRTPSSHRPPQHARHQPPRQRFNRHGCSPNSGPPSHSRQKTSPLLLISPPSTTCSLPTCLSSTSSSSLNPQPSLPNLKTSSPLHPVPTLHSLKPHLAALHYALLHHLLVANLNVYALIAAAAPLILAQPPPVQPLYSLLLLHTRACG